MLIAHPTTEDHYRKYAELASFTGYATTTYCPVGEYEYLLEKYLEDRLLNNIPLKVWDNWGIWLRLRTKRLSMAELCCLGKHLVIYRILGAIPIFYERINEGRLTAHGFKELSNVSTINYEKCGEDRQKFEIWRQATIDRFIQARIKIV